MDIRKLVSKEQFDQALKEVREENWKVDMFFSSNGAVMRTYDDFPVRLKDKLDELLLEKLKGVIRYGKIDDLLK